MTSDFETITSRLTQTLKLVDGNADRFERLLIRAVKLAHDHQNRHRKQPRARDVRPYFERLREALLAVQSFASKPNASKPDWSGEAAGTFIEAVKPGWIADALDTIDRAERAATCNPKTRLSVGRTTTAVRPAFNLFLYDLFMIEQACGFKWSAHKDRISGKPAGSLIDAVAALAEHLPKSFVPDRGQTLLRAINAVRKNMRG